MSAPTRELRMVEYSICDCNRETGGVVHGSFEPTPADVRLWLLDQGATEMKWCETHDASVSPIMLKMKPNNPVCRSGQLTVEMTDAMPADGCRMVLVLVWKDGGS